MASSGLHLLPARHGFAPDDLELLTTVGPTRQFAVGTYLCEQGKPAYCAFLLLAGEVEVLREVEGRTMSLAKMGPGEIVGQLALVDGAPRGASVLVRRDVEALLLMRDMFEKLLASQSPLALRFQRQVAVAGIRQLRRTTERLAHVMLALERETPRTEEERASLVRRRRDSAITALAALEEPGLDMELDQEVCDVTDRTLAILPRGFMPEPPIDQVMAPTAIATLRSGPGK
ncbi:MAG: cyclic nucleotide-binding domain-containing protein [Myxococcales bacterium]|nr:cyclic nucleotide-binding domain-containing protein [Myxococcales bacterium]